MIVDDRSVIIRFTMPKSKKPVLSDRVIAFELVDGKISSAVVEFRRSVFRVRPNKQGKAWKSASRRISLDAKLWHINAIAAEFRCPICGQLNEIPIDGFEEVGTMVVEMPCLACDTQVDVQDSHRMKRKPRPLTEADIEREMGKKSIGLADLKVEPNDSPEGTIVVHPANQNVFNVRDVLGDEPVSKPAKADWRARFSAALDWASKYIGRGKAA